MQDLGEVVERVERLELENKRLRMVGGATVAVLMAAALVGAVSPQAIPDVMAARAFRVIGNNGTDRAVIDADGISYHDENGILRGAINADGIGYFDELGRPRAGMTATGIGHTDENGDTRAAMMDLGILYFGENGVLRAWMNGLGVAYYDENVNLRARLGAADLATASTGVEARVPAVVALYDEQGNVIWRAPR